MISVRKSEARGHTHLDWLDSQHTFSFGSYYDPKQRGFSDLLVINEDHMQPGGGFGRHGHSHMEIISYILEGAVAHEDSMGSSSVLKYGDVQCMSAGSGILHSEFNYSKQDPAHFFQIWITPQAPALSPAYKEKHFSLEEKTNRLRLIVSSDSENGSLPIRQDVCLYATVLEAGKRVVHPIRDRRRAWLQVARGTLDLNGTRLTAGDGAAISGETELRLTADQPSEALLFDLR